MDAFTGQDVDGSSERCGDRWDEDSEATVLELLDDETWYESLLDLYECRLPNVLSAFPRDLLRETSKQRVSRNSREKRPLHPLAERFAQARADGAPIRKHTVKTRMRDRTFSAGSQAGSSIVNGRIRVPTDCAPLSRTNTAR
jgi:hypothetical protein